MQLELVSKPVTQLNASSRAVMPEAQQVHVDQALIDLAHRLADAAGQVTTHYFRCEAVWGVTKSRTIVKQSAHVRLGRHSKQSLKRSTDTSMPCDA
jgi:DNA-binding response OmpR family regulator